MRSFSTIILLLAGILSSCNRDVNDSSSQLDYEYSTEEISKRENLIATRSFFYDDSTIDKSAISLVKIEERLTGNYENRYGFIDYAAADFADSREAYPDLSYEQIARKISAGWKESSQSNEILLKNSSPLVYFRNYNLFALTPYFDLKNVSYNRILIRQPKYSFEQSLARYNLFLENYESSMYYLDIEHVNFISK